MNLPKISIVTPSFNQGKYLEETIRSVISQRYPNLEYIIIDGGSTDNSVEIIKKYASDIHYWESEKDHGQSEAINKGLRRSTGDIVTWLNSDDCYTEGTLHKVADYFSKGDFAFLYGKSILSGHGMEDKIIGLSDKENAVLKCLAYVPFPQPSTFYRRNVLAEQGYLDENLHYCMDHDLFLRIILNTDLLGTDDVFSKYRYHPEGKSNYPAKFAEERIKVFSKVVRSFPGTEELVQMLREIGSYSEGTDVYKSSKQFSEGELKRAFVYFLEVQMHYYYDAHEKQHVKTIAKFLLRYNDSSVRRGDARKLYLRTLFLDKHIISFLRKFTRS